MGKSDQYCRPLPKTSRFAKADPSTETLKKALFPGRKGGIAAPRDLGAQALGAFARSPLSGD